MNILDHISDSLETNFWVKIFKFFDADVGPGSGNLFDPGSGIRDGKNSDPGSGINIPDSQHWRYCSFKICSAIVTSLKKDTEQIVKTNTAQAEAQNNS
jgi:hypothetical protein